MVALCFNSDATIEFKAQRARVETSNFPRQEMVKPLHFPSRTRRTRCAHENGLDLAASLFLVFEYCVFQNLAKDFTFNHGLLKIVGHASIRSFRENHAWAFWIGN